MLMVLYEILAFTSGSFRLVCIPLHMASAIEMAQIILPKLFMASQS